jgi:hypothetical protein
MSNPVLVVIVALLLAAFVYLAISFGVFGSVGKAARKRDDQHGKDGEGHPHA